ncbi:hypothetical protein, partial [Aeromonas caviae]|uniref:hypothetical protein n=1 Tax=Aeromonas caviae TaxID=648 RepID=UPI001CC69F7A
YDARRQQGDGGGVFGDNQFTSTLSVNFHFPRIPRRTSNYAMETAFVSCSGLLRGIKKGSSRLSGEGRLDFQKKVF